MGSLLDDIDDIIDDGDVVVNCGYEINNTISKDTFKNVKKLPSHSTKYSILKNIRNSDYKKTKGVELFSIPWECESILKYFDLADTYKSAEFVMKEYVIDYNLRTYTHHATEFYIIFRGHNKKNDNAIMICKTANARDCQDNIKTIVYNLSNIFHNENKFNSMINRVRHYLKMDTKFFKFLKNENA